MVERSDTTGNQIQNLSHPEGMPANSKYRASYMQINGGDSSLAPFQGAVHLALHSRWYRCAQPPATSQDASSILRRSRPASVFPVLLNQRIYIRRSIEASIYPSLTLPALKETVDNSEQIRDPSASSGPLISSSGATPSEGFLFSTSSSYLAVSNNCLST